MDNHTYAMQEIAKEVKKYIELMPRKKKEIYELAQGAHDEIYSGESIDNELMLMCSELDELLDQEAAL